MQEHKIEIYTDGSCHTQLLTGAWAALIFADGNKITLQGVMQDTTHNRMELLAVIKAFEWIGEKGLKNKIVDLYSDSQYVINLTNRREKLEAKNFITNKGTPIQNIDLVQLLLNYFSIYQVNFFKVKAHQKPNGTQNFNREVDMIVRKLVRENVREND